MTRNCAQPNGKRETKLSRGQSRKFGGAIEEQIGRLVLRAEGSWKIITIRDELHFHWGRTQRRHVPRRTSLLFRTASAEVTIQVTIQVTNPYDETVPFSTQRISCLRMFANIVVDYSS